MSVEITTEQARAVAALRRRWPAGVVTAHQRPWGVILEVQVHGHAVDLVALHADGAVEPATGLRHAA
jgi:hypothetical protein